MLAFRVVSNSTCNANGTGCNTYNNKWNDGKGYKKIGYKHKVYYVHRLMWQFAYGSVPGQLVIDHKCRNPACWNVDHLEAVTVEENTKRGNGKWIFETTKAAHDNHSIYTQACPVGQSNHDGLTPREGEI